MKRGGAVAIRVFIRLGLGYVVEVSQMEISLYL